MVKHNKDVSQKEHKKHAQSKRDKQKAKGKKIQSLLVPIGILIVVLLAVYFIITAVMDSTPVDITGMENLTITQIATNDNIKGNADAPVLLIEYSDFQCPACSQYVPLIKQLIEEKGNDVAVVYRHFPLSSIHPNAQAAAYAAQAADNQGAFWEMHDLLFENQATWGAKSNPQATFVEYAQALGLDTEQFKLDMASDEVKAIVAQHTVHAAELNLRGTPSFFINGKPLRITSYEQLVGVVDSMLTQ